MPIEAPLAGLATLLNAAFTIEEFQRLVVAHLDPEFLHDLPNSSTPSQFFLAVVTLLQRRGGIDKKFFSTLVKARPRRKTEIDDVRSRFGLDTASKAKPTRSVKSSRTVTPALPPVHKAAPAPSREEVLMAKLGQALKAFSKAGNNAEADDEWKPVVSWWKEWGPSFQVMLTTDEYEQISGTTRAPKRRVKIYGKNAYTSGETVEERVAEIRSTLKGYVNKYKPVKSKTPRGAA
jgi:hypothetical protein